MSLIRQIRLLLLGVLLLAIAGSVSINFLSARETLQTQLRLKNSDNAQALALALSQQHGDEKLMELLMAAQFDTGFYRSIRFVRSDGKVVFERHADSAPGVAPRWFAALAALDSVPGVAQVSDGWRALGRVEVVSQAAYALDELWLSALRVIVLMLLVGAVAMLLAGLVVRRIRRPLAATVEQANALVDGRYVTVEEPHTRELKRLVQAMNGMVQRMRLLFDSQAAQAEALRRQAHTDPLTGVAHRAHFMERLQALLRREDGADAGLVLVRLSKLPELNLSLGRETVDRALAALATTLQTYPDHAPDCFVGRLNGSDFALALPAAGMAAETAQSIAAALQSSLPTLGAGLQVHLGAVELSHDAGVGAVMARADLALARAEAHGPFAVELANGTPAKGTVLGERAWRAQLVAALAEPQRALLVEFPVIDKRGMLSHLECPLRLRLDGDGRFDVAARWLPLAARSRLTAQIDSLAIKLALDASARDGRPRGVNIAAASLSDGGFAAHVRHLLHDTAGSPSKLWLEVSESAAIESFEVVQEFGRLVRPLGVRFGLEHAGQRLSQIERLYELGLDYVKLDAALCAGVATNGVAREFVKTTAALLHALSVQVQAEGIVRDEDVQALWACGVDAVTGPWASARTPS
jgi:EAL domain-containing protein (putative c-di-GMP-specific phosphodiesterase class I)/GGDEF domain-containing protein